MSDPHTVIHDTLSRLQCWLSIQQRSLHAPSWQVLCAEIDEALMRIEALVAQGRVQEAVAELEALVRRYQIPDPLKIGKWADRSIDEVNRSGDPEIFVDHVRSGSPHGKRTSPLDLVHRITQLLGPSREQTAVVHPEMRMPDEICALTTFTIFVATQAQETIYSGDPLSVTRRAGTPFDLDVEVIVPLNGGLELRSPAEGVLRIDQHGRSAALCFELFALTAGTYSLQVAFRSGGIERTRLTGDIEVRPQNHTASARVVPPLMTLTARPLPRTEEFSGLLLQIIPTSVSTDKRSYKVALSSSGWQTSRLEGDINLPGDCTAMLAELCREMTQKAKETITPQSRLTRLRNIGANLANSVLPSHILDALFAERWPEGTLLHIESDDLHLPWELLHCSGHHNLDFLGERFAITRYPRIGMASDLFGGGPTVLVAPRSAKLPYQTELESLKQLLDSPPLELSSLDSVQQLLRGTASCGVLHFACHGDSVVGEIFGDKLQLDGGQLSIVDVPQSRRGQSSALAGALVFINACRAHTNPATLWGQGWGGAFLRAGASAVVLPAWSVSNLGAESFAQAVYRGVRRRLPLGEAVRRARKMLGPESSLDHLAYAVLASPNARMVPQKWKAEL